MEPLLVKDTLVVNEMLEIIKSQPANAITKPFKIGDIFLIFIKH